MKWFSTLSEAAAITEAQHEVAEAIQRGLDGRSPDVLFIFVHGHAVEDYPAILQWFSEKLGHPVILGCQASGVIGAGQECEYHPGLSVTAALLPEVKIQSFHYETGQMEQLKSESFVENFGMDPAVDRDFILIADPLSFDPSTFLYFLDHHFPKSQKIGALASGGQNPGSNLLFLQDQIYHSGVVGLSLSGNLQLDTVLSQGCHGIGLPYFATRFQGNVLQELDGRPTIDVLEELFHQLPEAKKSLFHNSLFLGLAPNIEKDAYQPGEFLIRNILGYVEAQHGFAISGYLKQNQVVQFHLRDAQSSHEDLERAIAQYARSLQKDPSATPIEGALLFSCVGRGLQLYHEVHHDSQIIQRSLGPIPLGGFFGHGEIGPVEGHTYLHRYTSVLGVFREKPKVALTAESAFSKSKF